MKTTVISLGGSLLIPKEKADLKFLHKFKKELRKNYKKSRFVIVTGGGSIARQYISLLKEENKSKKELSLAGIRATRMNAQTVMQFFGKEANQKLPKDEKSVKSNLHKNNVVVCGALRYTANSTSDGTSAKLAHFLKAPFINMTNVKGLYTSDPRKNKNAKFTKSISWKDFDKMAQKLKFKAGQHFILDQQASTIIKNNKIPTYIIGSDVNNISRIINNKKFTGTLIAN